MRKTIRYGIRTASASAAGTLATATRSTTPGCRAAVIMAIVSRSAGPRGATACQIRNAAATHNPIARYDLTSTRVHVTATWKHSETASVDIGTQHDREGPA